MNAITQNERPDDQILPHRRKLQALIRQQVLRALGEPADFRDVAVRHLWEDFYRVNVVVGADAAAVTIPHSYFVATDTDGQILTSTPMISRRYS